MTKACTKCGTIKPLDKFYKKAKCHQTATSKHMGQCKECYNQKVLKYQQANPKRTAATMWKSHLKTRYGITVEQYDAIAAAQDGKCAICGCVEDDGRKLALDHNHKTGKTRELLCIRCNLLIGRCDESILLLAKAAMYLQKHNDEAMETLIDLVKKAG